MCIWACRIWRVSFVCLARSSWQAWMMNLWDNFWIRDISPSAPKIKPFAPSCQVWRQSHNRQFTPPVRASKARRGDSQAGRPKDSRHQARCSLRDAAKPIGDCAHRFSTTGCGNSKYARTDFAQIQAKNGRAQFPHSRTIPHKFFCRLLPLDAK